MAESITLEPNWDGMRAWVRHVYRTDPVTAMKIAAEMGPEAPDFSDLERPVGLDRSAYSYGGHGDNTEGEGNAMADAIDQYFYVHNKPEQAEDDLTKVDEDLEWAVNYWRTHGGREEI